MPVIHEADVKTLGQIAATGRRLAESVRAGTITPPELSGATFTVSNLGMYGMTAITPVINPPQAAILGVGAIRDVLARGAAGEIVDRKLLTLTLSCDHRILYGADAAHVLGGDQAVARVAGRLGVVGECRSKDGDPLAHAGRNRQTSGRWATTARYCCISPPVRAWSELSRRCRAARRWRGGPRPDTWPAARSAKRSRRPRRCWTPVMRSASTCSESASTIRRPPTRSSMTTGHWRQRSPACRPRRGCRLT